MIATARRKPTGALPKKKNLIRTHRSRSPSKKRKYLGYRLIGSGTFGSVYKARTIAGKVVAIKSVKQDPQYKNRELEILKILHSRYCIKLKDHYFTRKNNGKDVYLNIVMDYFPYTVHSYTMKLRDQQKRIGNTLLKILAYQIFAGLRYLHAKGIVHRDIKPENIMFSPVTGKLKITDFGSAKVIKPGDTSVSYIASRFYRAPELILGCEQYTGAIDVWAAGCVIAEMLRMGEVLFEGMTGTGQIIPIIQLLGKPTQSDLSSFQHTAPVPTSLTKPIIKLEDQLPKTTNSKLIALLKQIFVYNPTKRITAAQCLQHPYFEDLFKEGKMIPNTDRPVASIINRQLP